MPADAIHLVRHGEVHNPERVLYGRLPGYPLTERGRRMASLAAAALAGREIATVISSPLRRTRESAAPFGRPVAVDERAIEPWNRFEGGRMREALRRPSNWPLLVAPWRPSWGEPYAEVRDRMLAAMDDAWERTPEGEVVIVSHQMPIETVARAIAGRPLAHNPAKRRTSLSSITSFVREPSGRWVEVSYQEPAASLLADAIDSGAV